MKIFLSPYLWLPGLLLVPLVALAQTPPVHVPVGSELDRSEEPREAPAGEEPAGELALREAVAAALLRSPDLAVFSFEVRAAEARALQAGLLPNPELSVEVENVGGSGDRSATEQTETTIWLSQLVELGGNRAKRRRVADFRGDLAQWDYETARLTVLTETTKAFVETLAAQSRLSLARELELLARASVATVADQVRAGAAAAVEKTRAEVVLLSAELERQQRERELASRRLALAATWAGTAPRFSGLRGDLSADVTSPPPLAALESRVASNPDLARWGSALAEREARLSLERARGIPNPTLALGGRHFNDNDDGALVFALSVPLPVFDRNQGGVLEATRELSKARAQKAAAELSVRSTLARRQQDLASTFERATTLRERTLPAAERAFDGTRDGYRRGLFRYLDVLDAQRTLFELRAQYVEVLSAYHQARADIERLTGASLRPATIEGEGR